MTVLIHDLKSREYGAAALTIQQQRQYGDGRTDPGEQGTAAAGDCERTLNVVAPSAE